MRLADLTDLDVKILAKVRCGECISRRRKEHITPELARMAYGETSLKDYIRCMDAGLIAWDNGSVLTRQGTRILNQALRRAQDSAT